MEETNPILIDLNGLSQYDGYVKEEFSGLWYNVNNIEDSKENIFRYSELPEPEGDLENLFVQYIGDTDQNYTQGYFYKCVGDYTHGEPTYSWVQIDIQPETVVPTNVSAFTNDAGYTTNIGTITSVKMNGSTVSSSGEADLGTVITEHQSIKTINSTSLVGTGDVEVQPTLVSGTNIKTINSTSLLGSGDISITENVQADWDEADPTAESYINNKPTLFSGSYNDLSDKPTIPDELSDLSDDSSHRLVTDTEKSTWNAKSDFSGSYNDLSNKPTIPDELSDLSDDSTHRLVTDTEKSTWNAKSDFSGSYTDLTDKPTIPDELSDLSDDSTHRLVTDTEKSTWSGKQDTLVSGTNIKTINSTSILGSGDITITVPTALSDLTNDEGFIDNTVSNLTNYTLATDTGSTIDLSIDSSTYVVTLTLKNAAGTTISSDTIDLPLESVVVSGSYDDTTKKIILTLQSGSTVEFSVADLVSGLQTEITSNSKLSADLVDDTSTTNKFVSSSDKTAWNAKYDLPSGGIPSTDLASAVQTSLGKADTAIQSSDLATVATSGDYDDLLNKPTLFSGSYNDLSDKPTIPDELSDLTDDATHRLVTDTEKSTWNAKSDFSGSYNDLSNKPTIPDELADLSDDSTHRVVTDTEKSTWSGKQDALVSGTNIKTINSTSILGSGDISITGNVQADWNESSSSAESYINNKPTNVSAFTNDAGYTTNTGTITSVKMNGTTISSSGEADLGTVITDISGKQDTLVSGTNIKTINSTSLLGSGNIEVLTPPEDTKVEVSRSTSFIYYGGMTLTFNVGTLYIWSNYVSASFSTTVQNTYLELRLESDDSIVCGIYLGDLYSITFDTSQSNIIYNYTTSGLTQGTRYYAVLYSTYNTATFDEAPRVSMTVPFTDDQLVTKYYVDSNPNAVTTNTAQTISAVKTFTALPVSSVTPTTDNQLTRKKYVDDAIAGHTPDLSNYYTKSQTYSKTEVDNAFSTNLANYYTKTQTYTKTEVDNKIDDIELNAITYDSSTETLVITTSIAGGNGEEY